MRKRFGFLTRFFNTIFAYLYSHILRNLVIVIDIYLIKATIWCGPKRENFRLKYLYSKDIYIYRSSCILEIYNIFIRSL